MNPLQVTIQEEHLKHFFLYICACDLAEIFMNILVTRKISFYFAHRKSEMESSGKKYSIHFNSEDTANQISYICSFVHFVSLFHCPNVMNSSGDSTCV